jgi:hypothetical protein
LFVIEALYVLPDPDLFNRNSIDQSSRREALIYYHQIKARRIELLPAVRPAEGLDAGNDDVRLGIRPAVTHLDLNAEARVNHTERLRCLRGQFVTLDDE